MNHPTHNTAKALHISHVYKSFANTAILKDISIEAKEGEFLVLVGPSGCGKSTLLSCIAGFEAPSSGSISLLNQELTTKAPSERDIAMVFQSYALYPNMSVEKNITFAMNVHKVDKRIQQEKLTQVAEKLQLSALLKRKPAQLSGGQRQRVAMARALVREPKLFLFDEPLSNLDAKLRVSMRTEIKRLHQELGTTMVYVTHDQIEAMTLASKIVVMRDGEVRQIGSPNEIYAEPKDCFVAQFMGSPSMNLLEVTASSNDGKTTNIHFQSAMGDCNIIIREVFENISDTPCNILLGIRPEHFSLAPPSSQTSDTQIALKVDIIEPTGSDIYILSSLMASQDAEKVTIRLPANTALSVGEIINVQIDSAQVSLFDINTQQRINKQINK